MRPRFRHPVLGVKSCRRFFRLTLVPAVLLGFGGPPVGHAQISGPIVAWGNNSQGQCDVPAPNEGFVAVAAAGQLTAGLKADATIVVWGDNSYFQCDVPEPNEGFAKVATGGGHCLGLKAGGSIVAWGANTYGQCDVPSPNTGFVDIAAGNTHSLALRSDGTVVAWGNNFSGECDVPGGTGSVVAIAAGGNHSIALTSSGAVVPWGTNLFGQSDVPEPNSEFIAIADGAFNTAGLKADGSIVVWGSEVVGLGNVPLPNERLWGVSVGIQFCVLHRIDGTLGAWGVNTDGQCDLPSPDWTYWEVAAGGGHVAAIRNDGAVWHVPGDAATISDALILASPGETVVVGCGTYPVDSTLDVPPGVFLRSETGDPNCVVLDGLVPAAVVSCLGTPGRTRIQGLSFTNGSPAVAPMLQVDWGSSTEVLDCRFGATQGFAAAGVADGDAGFTNCEFVDNQTASEAVSVGSYGTPVRMIDCTFQGNTAGAVEVGQRRTYFTRCRFSGNTSPSYGTAVRGSGSELSFRECVFDGNVTPDPVGAAVHLTFGSARFASCTFHGNQAAGLGGAVYVFVGTATFDRSILAFNGGRSIMADGAVVMLTCSDLYGNSGGDWVGLFGDQLGQDGNISSDPLFCDAAAGDLSISGLSPCAGSPSCGLMGALPVGCDRVWYVPSTAPTIQAALDSATAGETVELSSGTYSEHGLVLPPGVWLRGETGDPADVVIDGASQGRILALDGGDPTTRVEGITFTGGYTGATWPDDGGSALKMTGSSPRITACRFVANHTDVDGTVLAWASAPIFSGCEFSDNTAGNTCAGLYFVDAPGATVTDCSFTGNACSPATGYGGAGMTWNSTVDYVGCRFSSNSAAVGGAIRASNQSVVTFTDCVFDGNLATNQAGALFLDACDPTLTGCTLFGNTSGTEGGGIACSDASLILDRTIVAFSTGGEAIACLNGAAPVLTCSDLHGNEGGDWTGPLAGQLGTAGNFSADPLFCDPAGGNLALAATSPCLPGNHPAGASCGTIGAFAEGCTGPVAAAETWTIPPAVALHPSTPNPFRRDTRIRFDLPGRSPVVLRVYDVVGRVVRTVVDDDVPAGRHTVIWNGTDERGRRVSSGVYFYRLEAGRTVETRKVVRLVR